jgi:uncharacterized membrane protein
MAMSEWYYAADNEQKGPVSEAELKGLLASSRIPGDTLVWKDGMENWTPAGQLPEFRAPAADASSGPKVVSAGPGISNPESATPVDFSQLVGKGEALEVSQEDADTNKVFGILAYIGPLCFVAIIVAKDSPYAKYHANQGLVLFVAEIATMIITSALLWIPFLGLVVYFLHVVLSLVFLVAAILGIINAAAGKCVPLPFIGAIKLLK